MDTAIQSMGDMALSQAALPRLSPSAAAGIDKSAQEFTGLFFAQMLQPMFEGLPVDPVFGGGHGEEIMRSFLVQDYGKMVAQHGGGGLTDAVRQEMIKAQANPQPAARKRGAYAAAQ